MQHRISLEKRAGSQRYRVCFRRTNELSCPSFLLSFQAVNMSSTFTSTPTKTSPLSADQSSFGSFVVTAVTCFFGLWGIIWTIFVYKWPPKGSQGPRGLPGLPGKDGEPNLAALLTAAAAAAAGAVPGFARPTRASAARANRSE